MNSSDAPPPAVVSRPPGTRSARILVAEDDAEMRRLVVEALHKGGYQVAGVSDGGRMLVALADGLLSRGGAAAPDLIVSDVRLPGFSGIEVVERLRAARLTTPVILMTAFGDDATRKKAQSLGALLLDKPFDIHELLQTVASLV